MVKQAKPTFFMLAILTAGVVIGVFARQPVAELFQSKPEPLTPPTIKLPPPPNVPPTPAEVAEPHLSRADQECRRVVEEHVRAIDSFFTDSKKNTRSFAEEALSWASKWRLMSDYVPFTSGGRHEKFIRGKFEEFIFQPSQLEEAVRQVVASYIKHVESIEGKMLVRLRADVADFPSAYPIAQFDESRLQAAYAEALSKTMEATSGDLHTDIATELVSIIAGEVLAQVAARIGVSAGILGTGAVASWATFGVGAVVGLIVDQIVSWVWDWYADPTGDLAVELDSRLDEINRLIVDGSGEGPGLRDRLRAFAAERARMRSESVLSAIQLK